MYNLLIALGISVAAFVVGGAVTGAWVAGFIPGTIGFAISYFLLARRTGRKLEALMKGATAQFQKGNMDGGRHALEAGFGLGKWQFLIGAQIHAQLGALDYMQRRFKQARVHLEKTWSRHWMPQAMLAAIDHREKKHQSALERLEKLTSPGGKDPTFWGLYAYVALESGDRERALSILAQASKKLPDSEALKGMTKSVQNKRKLKMKAFAPGWYQFFPEQMPRQMMMNQSQARPGYSYPQPRR